jgi:hypothetical protein
LASAVVAGLTRDTICQDRRRQETENPYHREETEIKIDGVASKEGLSVKIHFNSAQGTGHRDRPRLLDELLRTVALSCLATVQ